MRKILLNLMMVAVMVGLAGVGGMVGMEVMAHLYIYLHLTQAYLILQPAILRLESLVYWDMVGMQVLLVKGEAEVLQQDCVLAVEEMDSVG